MTDACWSTAIRHFSTAAYLVMAEALTNVAEHAGATRVWADVVLNGDVVIVEVRDDGVGGADPARRRAAVGMLP